MTHTYVRHDSFICVACLVYLLKTWNVIIKSESHRKLFIETPKCVVLRGFRSSRNESLWRGTRSPYVLLKGFRILRLISFAALWHDSFIWVACLIYQIFSQLWCLCTMTHSFVWHDSFMCVTWLIHMYDMTHSYEWHAYFTRSFHSCGVCAPWLIHVCDITHSCVWHDWSICIARSYVWHDTFICVTWLIHICDMTPPYVWCGMTHSLWCGMTHSNAWHDSFMCVTSLIHVCDMTHSYI